MFSRVAQTGREVFRSFSAHALDPAAKVSRGVRSETPAVVTQSTVGGRLDVSCLAAAEQQRAAPRRPISGLVLVVVA